MGRESGVHQVAFVTAFVALMSLVGQRFVTATTVAERLSVAGPADRAPNELGRIPILLYHELGDTDERWRRSRDRFRADLELLHARGYRPVGIGEVLDRSIDLPRGLSPVVITFDDAPPSQFRYVERPDGTLAIDSTSAVGILLDFARTHPDWRNRAVFCVLTGAEAGHAMFGGKNIEGQRVAWRHAKLRQLVALGFELCGHTDWHANLGRVADSTVPGHIARGLLAIDSAVPGYHVRSFALPYGAWPQDSARARAGHWRDPVSGRVVDYRFDAVFEAWGGTIPSPFDQAFRPLRLPRVQVTADDLDRLLDELDRSGRRYVSDGDPRSVARPPRAAPLHHADRDITRGGDGGFLSALLDVLFLEPGHFLMERRMILGIKQRAEASGAAIRGTTGGRQ